MADQETDRGGSMVSMCTQFDSLTYLEPTSLHLSPATSPSQSFPLLRKKAWPVDEYGTVLVDLGIKQCLCIGIDADNKFQNLKFSLEPKLTMSFLGVSLLAFFILTSILLVSSQNDNEYEDVVKSVKKINKHVLLTIKSPDGDLIDKRNKPCFNHSILRDHTIQEVPTQMLKRKKYARNSRINKAFQICRRNRMMCTNNTIPVRRSTIADVMRLNSTSELKKKQKPFRHQLPIFTENHEYASVVYDAVAELYGVAGAIKMARPSVSGENGCSQSHVQIKTGSGQDFESITVGWNVCPELNGDNNIRLFLLWTRDGYQTTKCYNYECNGFVAENDEDNEDDVVLGDELEPSPAHPDIYVKIWKDPVRQIWSLMIDDEVMGEWRRDIFPRLGGIYTSVEWGGEVSNNRTQMGSGRFENEEGACYIRNLEIMTSGNSHHPIEVPFEELTERETNPELYNVSIKHNRRYIYFGGPGLTA
ncbi:uncharacterized protein LOC119987709 [Tripterygium wilfordii]|uniref:uncharacterized protein LOC119987709 n=1 Tax=Tripterygium wilfordii TaxID=458696 RepID=UPI0018F85B46|nr:uncharacterized protein LOC119987709 [Tripterygium wilfordii]